MSMYRIAVRVVGLTVGIMIGVVFGAVIEIGGTSQNAGAAAVAVAIAIGGIGYIMGPHVVRGVVWRAKEAVADASIEDIVAIVLGFAFGALVAAPIAFIVSLVPGRVGDVVALVLAIIIIASAIVVAQLRKHDLIDPWFRRRDAEAIKPKPEREAIPAQSVAAMMIDTNIMIDGRVGDVVRSGFLPGTILVPQFILSELQRIADADDPLRRARGRRGLEALNQLRHEIPDRIEVVDDPVKEEKQVDAKLIRLARERGCRILTNDYNLEKVAQVQGVEVLNLNELANALRPVVRPGEEITLSVVQEGREAGQGVGFLDDGTMVVVDGGRRLVGSESPVTVTRLLQTGAGRMVFATPKQIGA